MTRAAFYNSPGYLHILAWMEANGMQPFDFQIDTWWHMQQGQSGLVIAPTGLGKTFSAFLGLVIYFINNESAYTPGLKMLWLTPLRSLAKDIGRAMDEALVGLGIDWSVGVRNGDTPVAERKKQTAAMPDILIVTPESLHLLLAQKEHARFFTSLRAIIADEWHELLSTKRGVMTELAVAWINSLRSELMIWGISATIGNIGQALEVLTFTKSGKRKIIRTAFKKETEIITLIPDEIEILPWAGHLGLKMAADVVPVIEQAQSTLIFTNTRSQAEMWYQIMLDVYPDLAGQIAIHHSSIDFELRQWIEENLSNGRLKAVVSTSSLDLGVDFKPVDTVIQVGSPKGVARFLQRAGRSGHSPFETSRIYFLPTHSFELLESAALQQAVREGSIEQRVPMLQTFDVLIQFLVTLAVGPGFDGRQLFDIIRRSYAFQFITADEWSWALTFITLGGKAFQSYSEYQRVDQVNGFYKVTNRRIAMLHRLNIGAIVSDAMIKVRMIGGGYMGMVEEYFISRLNEGDAFVLAGRVLEFVMIRDMTAMVRKSKKTKAIAPSYLGGRLPLSSNLSYYLRAKLDAANHGKLREPELRALRPLLRLMEERSHIPAANEFLVEMIETKEGHHLYMYPFEGRILHEIIAALIAYRLSQIQPISFSMAMNDYGFELLSDQPIPLNQENVQQILSSENLMADVIASINSTEMATRKFRDIAVISGLVIQNYFNKRKTNKNLQASAGLIFRVLEEHEPDNLLIRQAYEELFAYQIDEQRLNQVFNRIHEGKIILKIVSGFTPLSFPIMVDSMRQHMSNEELEARIRRMQATDSKKK